MATATHTMEKGNNNGETSAAADCSSPSTTTHCFLRISIAGQPSQTVVIQLFSAECPQTCQNFVTLITTPGKTTKQNPKPCYRGSEFHRIIDRFMVQGGDFEFLNGKGGYSPLSSERKTFLDDESFAIPHDQEGRVSMANRGQPHTNGSQFFITLAATPHLNHKHVCFGQVVQGMETVHAMVQVERDAHTNHQPAPLQRIVVVDCGLGKGRREENDCSDNSSSSDDGSRRRKRRRKERRKKKKKKKRKRKHRYDYSSDSSSEDDDERRRKKRRKKKEEKRSR